MSSKMIMFHFLECWQSVCKLVVNQIGDFFFSPSHGHLRGERGKGDLGSASGHGSYLKFSPCAQTVCSHRGLCVCSHRVLYALTVSSRLTCLVR